MNVKPGKEFPTEVQLGDTTYKVDENPTLKQFFEQTITIASQREKDKLYPTIQSKDAKIATLETELAKANADAQEIMGSFQNSVQVQTDLKKQLDQLNKAQPVIDAENVRRIIQEEFASKLPAATSSAIQPLQSSIERLEESRLSDYKAKRITEEGDKIIPELINGNTPEEIETSIAFSKEMRGKYGAVQTVVDNNVQNNKPDMSTNSTTPVQQPGQQPQQVQQNIPVATPKVTTPGNDSIPDIKGMTPEQFAAQRESLKEKLKMFEGTV